MAHQRPRCRIRIFRKGDGGELCALSLQRLQHRCRQLAVRQSPIKRATENVSITIPRTAIASSPAACETALLTPDAMPTRFSVIEFITVVVRGAILTAMPVPSTTTAGKKFCQ